MYRPRPIPTWLATLITVTALLLAVRITIALNGEIGGTVALRTYVFWALVCAPVAYLADVVVRSVFEYRVVRLAVARVRSRR